MGNMGNVVGDDVMNGSEKVEIMDEDGIMRAISRISFEIIEKNKGAKGLVVIGIQRRGVAIAQRIVKKIYEIEGETLPVGVLDITLYRDDLSMLSSRPIINGTKMDFKVDDKKIILVDDVLFTGRTVRAAIDAIIDMGRPEMIQLAILIDRGHREFPIKADYVGKNVPTSKNEIVHVEVNEIDGRDKVTITN